MDIQYITPKDSNYLPSLAREIFLDQKKFEDLLDRPSSLEEITEYAKTRNFGAEKRKILHKELLEQYECIKWSHQAVKDNIDALLNEDTFTVCTGQQVHICLGPFFLISKIKDIISIAQQTSQKDIYNIVPIFWLASEDHDFEEINSVQIYNQEFSREEEHGWPVGRLSPKSILSLLKQVEQKLDSTEENKKYLELCKHAYNTFPRLAQATHYILDQLFGDQGLVIIDADSQILKKQMQDIFIDECINRQGEIAILKQNTLLTKKWLKAQAHPRSINLFYMNSDHSRLRLEYKENTYQTVDNSKQRTKDELHKEIEKCPDKFSPNVFLRTLYQETILPNVAYISGPSELKYRLQMKELFALYKLQMPVLLPRMLTTFISEKNLEKVHTSPASLEEYFQENNALKKIFIKHAEAEQKHFFQSYEEVKKCLQKAQNKLDTDEAPKKLRKSLKNISKEISNIDRIVHQITQEKIEESLPYKDYLKIAKLSFDTEKRFERSQSVIWTLPIINNLIPYKEYTYTLWSIAIITQ